MSYDVINTICDKWNRKVVKRWNMLLAPKRFVENGTEKEFFYNYQKEIYRRSRISLKDIKALSRPVPDDWFYAGVIDSDEAFFYGDLQAMLHYSGLSSLVVPPKNLGVQHGYVFEIRDWEKSKLKKRNLVWSKRIVELYHKHTDNPDVYAVGAPFFYAQSFLNREQLAAEKIRLGKNLLAFPMHSQTLVDTNYNPDKFLEILRNERRRFDTVRVCMYWKDILRGSHKIYEDAGFECVCNGHLFDSNFLRRQKTFFELADATISNGVGSHIGYSVFMKKAHRLIDDECEYVNINKRGDAIDLTEVSRGESFQKIKNAFLDNEKYEINQQQFDVVDEFWGISDMKSPEELKKLLLRLYEL